MYFASFILVISFLCVFSLLSIFSPLLFVIIGIALGMCYFVLSTVYAAKSHVSCSTASFIIFVILLLHSFIYSFVCPELLVRFSLNFWLYYSFFHYFPHSLILLFLSSLQSSQFLCSHLTIMWSLPVLNWLTTSTSGLYDCSDRLWSLSPFSLSIWVSACPIKFPSLFWRKFSPVIVFLVLKTCLHFPPFISYVRFRWVWSHAYLRIKSFCSHLLLPLNLHRSSLLHSFQVRWLEHKLVYILELTFCLRHILLDKVLI